MKTKMDSEKVFFNIVSLSESFNASLSAATQDGQRVLSRDELFYWQVKAQIAIAQQLAMVSKSLRMIVETAAK